jgi:hypothetical protein
MIKVLFPVQKIRKTASGALVCFRNLVGGLRFAPFAKGGVFFLLHPRLCTPINSFLFPVVRTGNR